jgi:alcohol dehydrogenase class IV
LLSQQTGPAAEFVTGNLQIEHSAKPIIAVPTTAGTGSEATKFATVYVDEVKHSLEHNSLLPRFAVIDPAFTMSLPPYQTAVTGIDALSQAIESYWSVRSTDESRDMAARAIDLAAASLRTAVTEPDVESRLNMMKAANLAGKAINISRTTACHALSYYLTSRFGIPHGHAVGMTLARMLIYNSAVTADDVNDERGMEHVRDSVRRLAALLGGRDALEAATRIDGLMDEIGLGDPVPALQIDERHIRNMVQDAMASDRMSNNPRNFTNESLTSLLNSVFL